MDINEIIQKSTTHPTAVSNDHIESIIAKEQYHQFEGTTTTICNLTLNNGYSVTGESACVHPEDFNEDMGRHIARENAKEKLFQLEGYLLKEYLHTIAMY